MNITDLKKGDFIKKEGSAISLQVISIGYEWQSKLHFVEVYNDVTSQTSTLINVSAYSKVELNANNIDWICTDIDNNQWGRQIGDKVYEFKQDLTYPDGTVVTEEAEVNLLDYTDAEIENHISAYGYTIEQLYRDNTIEFAEWLMAECIFEQTVI